MGQKKGRTERGGEGEYKRKRQEGIGEEGKIPGEVVMLGDS